MMLPLNDTGVLPVKLALADVPPARPRPSDAATATATGSGCCISSGCSGAAQAVPVGLPLKLPLAKRSSGWLILERLGGRSEASRIPWATAPHTAGPLPGRLRSPVRARAGVVPLESSGLGRRKPGRAVDLGGEEKPSRKRLAWPLWPAPPLLERAQGVGLPPLAPVPAAVPPPSGRWARGVPKRGEDLDWWL